MKNKKSRYNTALRVWIPTGDYEVNGVRTVLRILFSPIFQSLVVIITTSIAIYFELTALWVWYIPVITVIFAIATIIVRRKLSNRPFVSERQARKCNAFDYEADWIDNRYRFHIDSHVERTQDDFSLSNTVYCQFAETLIALKVYDETGYTKIKKLSGAELSLVVPMEFHVDFATNDGIGYVILRPSVTLISKLNMVDERVVSHVLREVGIINYIVERVSYDDDLVLFVLKDETKSNAYNFCGGE